MVASEKTRAGVLRPRRADYEFIAAVAREWNEPATEVLRRMVELWARDEATAGQAELYDDLRAQYDRAGVWATKWRTRAQASP